MKVVLLTVGLLIGAGIGYLTRPEAAEIKLGPLSVEVGGNDAASSNDPLTSGQMRYIAICAAIGAAAGFGIGFAADRRGRV